MRIIEKNRAPFSAPIFFARAVDRINPDHKELALKEFESWKEQDTRIPDLFLIDQNGQIIAQATNAPSPEKHLQTLPHWQSIKKPDAIYGHVTLSSSEKIKNRNGIFDLFGPPGPPPPNNSEVLVKLSGSQNQYLLIRHAQQKKPPDDIGYLFPLIGLGSLLLSLLLGVGAAIAIVYNNVRKGVVEADRVISELHKGNLKARFLVTRKDEFGEAMLRFNIMADEIEKLVKDLKTVDQTRTQLLQELAHDLRTPIASLKNLIEGLDSQGDKLSKQLQKEITDLALKEIDYFGRLVEDLLFLAQVREPTYQNNYPLINISQLIMEISEDFNVRSLQGTKKIEIQTKNVTENLQIHADQQLIRRLIRNSLENAFSFANSKIEISLSQINSDKIEITVKDDGSGFSDEALQAFGTRRVTRQLDQKANGRLSVGLGSVVMKTICETHKGKIIAYNIKMDNKILGAAINITLPAFT